MKSKVVIASVFLAIVLIVSCSKDAKIDGSNNVNDGSYAFTFPDNTWEMFPIPADNPSTLAGVELGRKLFYDPIFSVDNTLACASCHKAQYSFGDNTPLSNGVSGLIGKRNAMPLFNLAWADATPSPHKYTWDGGATSIERQIIGPVTLPFEMGSNLDTVVAKLQRHPAYPALFFKAFGNSVIDINNVTYAIAQFERTLISYNSPFDRMMRKEIPMPQEVANGYSHFQSGGAGDCGHCHINGNLFTDYSFQNNGLSEQPDSGLAAITGKSYDMGKFKVPSLRNLLFTAPYMHDGSLKTLLDVIEFYNAKTHTNATTSEFITKHNPLGLQLTAKQKGELYAFLVSLSDSSFIEDTRFQRP